jgi:hypothetical protein
LNIITTDTIKHILKEIFNIQEKSVNIFNEKTKFIIFKRIDDDDPIGWYIMDNIDNETKEQVLHHINYNDIITIDITDQSQSYSAMVSVSSIEDQQTKSYYTSSNTYDCCLYPIEKVSMMFKLIDNS